MRTIALAMVCACGSQPAPVANTTPLAPAREDRPTCSSAIETWYFHAGIQPASSENAGDAKFEASIAAMRANQHALVEVCQQDAWSRDVRRCFTTIGSMALGVEAHGPDECKRMLDRAQLANLEKRIRHLGESALD